MRALITTVVAMTMVGCLGSEQPCSDRPSDPLCATVDGGARDGGGGTDGGGRDGGGPDGGGIDGGPMVDAGHDAAPMIDAHVPCNGACAGTTPHCLTSGTTETCVGCTGNGDCTAGTAHVCNTAGDHTCVGCVAEGDCTGSGMHCETTSHACVACLDSTQCGTVAASLCDTGTHACVPCTANGDCTHLTATQVCDAGTCVACTAANETACGLNSCNPATRTCTTTPRTTIGTCHACVADSECMGASDRCVPMQFMGAAHGSYCLKQLSAGCARPYTAPTPSRTSVSGAAATTYCGIDETVTSCEAVLALFADTACTSAADCGAAGLADGLCQTVNGVAGRCTYACSLSSQCPTGAACGTTGNYCGSP